MRVTSQELENEERAIVPPRERRGQPRIEVVLATWKDVRKAKADRARAARGKLHQSNARNSAAADADADAKVELSLRDMADVDPPLAALRGAVEELKNVSPTGSNRSYFRPSAASERCANRVHVRAHVSPQSPTRKSKRSCFSAMRSSSTP